MKLIMENWRRFLQEADYTNPSIAAISSSQDAEDAVMRSQAAKSAALGEFPLEFGKLVAKFLQSSANFIAMVLDPTGQFSGYDFNTGEIRTAVDDFADAKEAWKKEKSIFNGSMLAFSSVAFIPILGKAGKLAKFTRIAGFGKGLDRAEKILEATEVAARRATDPAKVRELNVVASMLRKKIDDSRRALEELDSYVIGQAGPVPWHISNASLEILRKLENGSLTAKMASKFSGPVYRGISISDWNTFVRIFPDIDTWFAKGDLIYDIERALEAPGEWVRISHPPGLMNASPFASGKAASFTKSKERAVGFASAHSSKLQVLVVSKGSNAPNVDVEKLIKNNPKVMTTRHSGAYEREVLMMGDKIPISDVYIRVHSQRKTPFKDFFSSRVD